MWFHLWKLKAINLHPYIVAKWIIHSQRFWSSVRGPFKFWSEARPFRVNHIFYPNARPQWPGFLPYSASFPVRDRFLHDRVEFSISCEERRWLLSTLNLCDFINIDVLRSITFYPRYDTVSSFLHHCLAWRNYVWLDAIVARVAGRFKLLDSEANQLNLTIGCGDKGSLLAWWSAM